MLLLGPTHRTTQTGGCRRSFLGIPLGSYCENMHEALRPESAGRQIYLDSQRQFLQRLFF